VFILIFAHNFVTKAQPKPQYELSSFQSSQSIESKMGNVFCKVNKHMSNYDKDNTTFEHIIMVHSSKSVA